LDAVVKGVTQLGGDLEGQASPPVPPTDERYQTRLRPSQQVTHLGKLGFAPMIPVAGIGGLESTEEETVNATDQ